MRIKTEKHGVRVAGSRGCLAILFTARMLQRQSFIAEHQPLCEIRLFDPRRKQAMKTVFTLTTLVLGLTFVGCDDSVFDKQADAVRDNTQQTADQIRDGANATAENVEQRGDTTADRYEMAKPVIEERAENRADAIEADGERKADQVEAAGERRADELETMDDNEPINNSFNEIE